MRLEFNTDKNKTGANFNQRGGWRM